MRVLAFVFASMLFASSRTDAQSVTTPEQAEKLEAGLQANPEDQSARMRLLSYYLSTNVPAAKALEPRRRHILWLIRNQPDNGMFGGSFGIIRAKGDRLADPEGYSEAAKLWRDQIAKSNATAATFAHAGEFFKSTGRDEALIIVETGLRRYPDHQRLGILRGNLYGMALTGAASVDQFGRPSGFPTDPLNTADSIKVRKALESVDNPNILIGVVASLGSQYYEFQKLGDAQATELFHLAEGYIERARNKSPEDVSLQSAISNIYSNAAGMKPLAKDKARILEKGAEMVTLPQQRSTILTNLAEAHFNNRQYDAAALDAEEVLKIVSANPNPRMAMGYGGSIHDANTILGRVALKRENPVEAKTRLLTAGRVDPSPMMSAMGPKFTLAQDLIQAGERDTVLEYITLCKNLWKNKDEVLDGWASTIRSGGSPEFQRRTIPSTNVIGTVAPAFGLKDLSGREHSLEEYKGKIVLLDFWATWCAPCRAEMPSFEKLHRELKDKDAVILAVDVGEGQDTVESYIKKEKFTFPVLMTDSGEMPNKYNVSAYPTLVVVDKAGRIADYIVGGRPEEQLRSAIDRGRAGAPPPRIPPVKQESVPAANGSAPVPVSPPAGATFNHFPRTTQVTWEPISGAVGYVVEWDYKSGEKWWSEDHNSQIAKLVTDTMFSFDFVGAQPGRWRVWAVLASGGTSAKSAWREFRYTR